MMTRLLFCSLIIISGCSGTSYGDDQRSLKEKIIFGTADVLTLGKASRCTELKGKEQDKCSDEVMESVGSFIDIVVDETMDEKDRINNRDPNN